MEPLKCLNCETSVDANHQYCSRCGQKTKIHRLNFHEVTHDALHYVTHADKSIFRLLKTLVYRPGVVAKDYIKGKRTSYFKPLNFYLIVVGIMVFMTSYFYTPNDASSQRMIAAAEYIQDPVKKQQLLSRAKRVRTINEITSRYSNLINMAALPFLSLFFWLAYRKKYNYTESIVANMYFMGFIMLVYALFFVPLQNLIPRITIWSVGLFVVFEIIYRGKAFYQMEERRSLSKGLKAYGISFLIVAFWLSLTYFLIYQYLKD